MFYWFWTIVLEVSVVIGTPVVDATGVCFVNWAEWTDVSPEMELNV